MGELTEWAKAHYAAQMFSDRRYRDQAIWLVKESIWRTSVYGEDDILLHLAKRKEGAGISITVESYMGLLSFTAEEAYAIACSM